MYAEEEKKLQMRNIAH